MKPNFARSVPILATLIALAFSVGCKPYKGELFEDVDTNETAFVVQLEGGDSARLNSIEDYENARVASRRIQISQRWRSTGRRPWKGEWVPNSRVIRVNRSPVTREWNADGDRDEAIWIESADSIGFSTGFNCTAYVSEEDAARFLYRYPADTGGGSRLARVMDEEIRNMIQSVAADFAAGFTLDEFRERKVEMVGHVRAEAIPYFAERGITITTVGMYGGLTYENGDIQSAIDGVFVAQQRKNEEAALLEAMEAYEARMTAEGQAEAARRREVANGEAQAIERVAAAEAERVREMTDALNAARENPLFLQIRALEVESERINRWDGSVPSMVMGGDGNGGGFVPMIQMPDVSRR